MIKLVRMSYKKGRYLGEVELTSGAKLTKERIVHVVSDDAKELGISAMFSIELVLNDVFTDGSLNQLVAREINQDKDGIRLEYMIIADDDTIPF